MASRAYPNLPSTTTTTATAATTATATATVGSNTSPAPTVGRSGNTWHSVATSPMRCDEREPTATTTTTNAATSPMLVKSVVVAPSYADAATATRPLTVNASSSPLPLPLSVVTMRASLGTSLVHMGSVTTSSAIALNKTPTATTTTSTTGTSPIRIYTATNTTAITSTVATSNIPTSAIRSEWTTPARTTMIAEAVSAPSTTTASTHTSPHRFGVATPNSMLTATGITAITTTPVTTTSTAGSPIRFDVTPPKSVKSAAANISTTTATSPMEANRANVAETTIITTTSTASSPIRFDLSTPKSVKIAASTTTSAGSSPAAITSASTGSSPIATATSTSNAARSPMSFEEVTHTHTHTHTYIYTHTHAHTHTHTHTHTHVQAIVAMAVATTTTATVIATSPVRIKAAAGGSGGETAVGAAVTTTDSRGETAVTAREDTSITPTTMADTVHSFSIASSSPLSAPNAVPHPRFSPRTYTGPLVPALFFPATPPEGIPTPPAAPPKPSQPSQGGWGWATMPATPLADTGGAGAGAGLGLGSYAAPQCWSPEWQGEGEGEGEERSDRDHSVQYSLSSSDTPGSAIEPDAYYTRTPRHHTLRFADTPDSVGESSAHYTPQSTISMPATPLSSPASPGARHDRDGDDGDGGGDVGLYPSAGSAGSGQGHEDLSCLTTPRPLVPLHHRHVGDDLSAWTSFVPMAPPVLDSPDALDALHGVGMVDVSRASVRLLDYSGYTGSFGGSPHGHGNGDNDSDGDGDGCESVAVSSPEVTSQLYTGEACDFRSVSPGSSMHSSSSSPAPDLSDLEYSSATLDSEPRPRRVGISRLASAVITPDRTSRRNESSADWSQSSPDGGASFGAAPADSVNMPTTPSPIRREWARIHQAKDELQREFEEAKLQLQAAKLRAQQGDHGQGARMAGESSDTGPQSRVGEGPMGLTAAGRAKERAQAVRRAHEHMREVRKAEEARAGGAGTSGAGLAFDDLQPIAQPIVYPVTKRAASTLSKPVADPISGPEGWEGPSSHAFGSAIVAPRASVDVEDTPRKLLRQYGTQLQGLDEALRTETAWRQATQRELLELKEAVTMQKSMPAPILVQAADEPRGAAPSFGQGADERTSRAPVSRWGADDASSGAGQRSYYKAESGRQGFELEARRTQPASVRVGGGEGGAGTVVNVYSILRDGAAVVSSGASNATGHEESQWKLRSESLLGSVEALLRSHQGSSGSNRPSTYGEPVQALAQSLPLETRRSVQDEARHIVDLYATSPANERLNATGPAANLYTRQGPPASRHGGTTAAAEISPAGSDGTLNIDDLGLSANSRGNSQGNHAGSRQSDTSMHRRHASLESYASRGVRDRENPNAVSINSASSASDDRAQLKIEQLQRSVGVLHSSQQRRQRESDRVYHALLKERKLRGDDLSRTHEMESRRRAEQESWVREARAIEAMAYTVLEMNDVEPDTFPHTRALPASSSSSSYYTRAPIATDHNRAPPRIDDVPVSSHVSEPVAPTVPTTLSATAGSRDAAALFAAHGLGPGIPYRGTPLTRSIATSPLRLAPSKTYASTYTTTSTSTSANQVDLDHHSQAGGSIGGSQLEVTRETLLAAHAATRRSRATLASLHDRMSSLKQVQSRFGAAKNVTFSDRHPR